MYTNHRRLHCVVQLLLDCLCIKLVWECTIYLRILLNPLMNAHVSVNQAVSWAPPIALVLPIWILVSFRLRLHRPPEQIRLWTVLVWGFENTVLLTAVTAVTTFFSRQFGEFVSRMFVPVMFPTAFLFFGLARSAGLGLLALAHKHWLRPIRIALVGDWRKSSHLIQRLQAAQTNIIRGLIVPEGMLLHAAAAALPVLGTTAQIAELINKEQLDRVIVMNATLPSVELEHCSKVFDRMGVAVSCALDFATEPVRLNLNTYHGLPFVEMTPIQFTRRQEIIKRIFDVTVSAITLLILAPLLLGIAAVIKFTSEGPVLYRSPRVGKGGRYFTFLKFRSMYTNNDWVRVAEANEKGGHIFKMRNDPRVTPIGRLLRRYSLDELPQLINVLRGEMSLVGPRPLPACDLGPDGMSQSFAMWSEGRARVHPGLTGLWQVSGRSDLAFEDMVRLDLAYIQNWSLTLDVKIILDTPMLVLRGVGAY
jgi:exopolysaccharide biosynthesis polyprenyl glycosylphosphotransferase